MDRTAVADSDTSNRGLYNARYSGKRGRDSEHLRGLKLIDLGDQNRMRVERRAHKRFQVKKNAFAIVRSNLTHPIRIKEMSMGEIALAVIKSDPLKLGRIKDLSMNGLVFCYIDNGKTGTGESFNLDILLADCGFYLEDLSLKTVSDFRSEDDFPFSAIKTRQLGGRFKEMNRSQVSKLRHLINNHIRSEE